MHCTKCRKVLNETNTRTYNHNGEGFPCCLECFEAQKVKYVYDKIQPAVEMICKELNGGDMKYISEAFYQAVDHEHRYLQNEMFIMFWKFFERYGNQKNFDARNEGAVKWAKKWYESV
jgi:hypothetical protein